MAYKNGTLYFIDTEINSVRNELTGKYQSGIQGKEGDSSKKSITDRLDRAIDEIEQGLKSGRFKGDNLGITPQPNEFEAKLLLAGFKAAKRLIEIGNTVQEAIEAVIKAIGTHKYYNQNKDNIDLSKVEGLIRAQLEPPKEEVPVEVPEPASGDVPPETPIEGEDGRGKRKFTEHVQIYSLITSVVFRLSQLGSGRQLYLTTTSLTKSSSIASLIRSTILSRDYISS